MMTSDAQKVTFAFTALTDEDQCHLSFNVDRASSINLQIEAVHVASLMENLARVLRQRDRKQFEKSILMQDRIAKLEKKLAPLPR